MRRRWRRITPHNHLAIRERRGRYAYSGAGRPAQSAFAFGRDARRHCARHTARHIPVSDAHAVITGAACRRERVARHRGHATRHRAVSIGVPDSACDGAQDIRPVHIRVRGVYTFPVMSAVPTTRHIDLARTEREPRDAGAIRATPTHERRRVHRAVMTGPGHPTPAIADVRPPAVVKGRVAPTRVVDPGPAPGRHPHPAAVAVRRPAHGNARCPHVSVLGL